MNAAQLIIDYVWICEQERTLFDFTEFVTLWLEADRAAREDPCSDASFARFGP